MLPRIRELCAKSVERKGEQTLPRAHVVLMHRTRCVPLANALSSSIDESRVVTQLGGDGAMHGDAPLLGEPVSIHADSLSSSRHDFVEAAGGERSTNASLGLEKAGGTRSLRRHLGHADTAWG